MSGRKNVLFIPGYDSIPKAFITKPLDQSVVVCSVPLVPLPDPEY